MKTVNTFSKAVPFPVATARIGHGTSFTEIHLIGLAALFWTILQVVTFFKNVLIYQMYDEPIKFKLLILTRLISWLTAFVFIVLIMKTTRKWLDRPYSWQRLVALHLVQALVMSFSMYALAYLTMVVTHLVDYSSTSLVKWYVMEMDRLFLIYLLFCAMAHAYFYYRTRDPNDELSRMTKSLHLHKHQLLYNRLESHLIFNLLQSVSTLVEESKQSAQDFIVQISEFLRYHFKEAKSLAHTIQDELRYLDRYVQLMKGQKGVSISYTVRTDEKLLSSTIPSGLLQPFIENAIKYGAVSKNGDKQISVEVKSVNDEIQIEMTNPSILARGKNKSTKEGWRLVIDRLRLCYGDRFHLARKIYQQKFTVEIRIPNSNKTSHQWGTNRSVRLSSMTSP
ncbi:MAG: histidine kinase [Saprospiraceae bacterium]|nr:histidine kinase [Saprospiraceae bacterium]